MYERKTWWAPLIWGFVCVGMSFGCGGDTTPTPEAETDDGGGLTDDANTSDGEDAGGLDSGSGEDAGGGEDSGGGEDADEGCHEIVFEGGFNGRVDGESTQCVASTGSGTPVEAIPRRGFTFRAWSDGNTDNPRTISSPEQAATLTAEFDTEGLKTVWLGHSFIRWNVELLYDVAKNDAGYTEHGDFMTFSGGSSGAPGSLWDDDDKRASGQQMIREQAPDNVVMTIGAAPGSSDFEDYVKWIDYTRQYSPDARFYISLPWPNLPFGSSSNPGWMTEEGAEDLSALYEDSLYPLVRSELLSRLRASYPDNEIVIIPQIIAADEIVKAHFAGTLTHAGPSRTFSPMNARRDEPNEHEESLFHDRTGHPGGPLRLLTMMLYLRYIYGVEVDTYTFWRDKQSFLNEGLEGPDPKEPFDVPYTYYDGFDFPVVADAIFDRYGRGE